MRTASARFKHHATGRWSSRAALILLFCAPVQPSAEINWGGILIALLIAVLAVGAFTLARMLFLPRPGNQGGTRPPRSHSPSQATHPVRLLHLWLTHGPHPGGPPVGETTMLMAGEPYRLNMQIRVPGQPDQIPVTAPFATVTQNTHLPPPGRLRVVIFAPQEDVQVDRSPQEIVIPTDGWGERAGLPLVPLHPGVLRVRACLYYGSVLLQSAYLEFNVALPSGRSLPGRVQQVMDYIASDTLADLNRFLQPTVSIFTNQAADGACWIGVYAAHPDPDLPLTPGSLKTFSSAEIASRAEDLRHMLAVIQGGSSYRYEPNLPLDQLVDRLESDLVRLAITGWMVYRSLFTEDAAPDPRERQPRMQSPGMISIARCHGGSPSIPWAALYDLHLDTNVAEPIRLCARFKASLIAPNPQPPPPTGGVPCRELADCPLNREKRKVTVCPYGFWGFLHQIEQPVQGLHISPRTKPIVTRRSSQTAFLAHPRGQKIRFGMGIYPSIPGASAHVGALRATASPGEMDVIPATNREDVLRLLTESSCHIYYFYCHGVVEDHAFRLMFGPAGRETYLSAADLERSEYSWKEGLHPLVILNGSETSALTPDLIQGFLAALKEMGASGVVGAEIPVHPRFAMTFGQELVCQVLSGSSLGEAFLALRRGFLALGNPLALVYTGYAPASLHLHDPTGCRWCKVHGIGLGFG